MKVALMPSQTDKVIDTSQTRLPTGCRLLNTTDAGAFASAIQQVYDSGFYETGLEDRLRFDPRDGRTYSSSPGRAQVGRDVRLLHSAYRSRNPTLLLMRGALSLGSPPSSFYSST